MEEIHTHESIYYKVRLPEFRVQFVLNEKDPETVENVDAHIVFPDGTAYYATFLTVAEIARIFDRWSHTGEALNGSYLKMDDLVIVTRPGLRIMIDALADIGPNSIPVVFSNIDPIAFDET